MKFKIFSCVAIGIVITAGVLMLRGSEKSDRPRVIHSLDGDLSRPIAENGRSSPVQPSYSKSELVQQQGQNVKHPMVAGTVDKGYITFLGVITKLTTTADPYLPTNKTDTLAVNNEDFMMKFILVFGLVIAFVFVVGCVVSSLFFIYCGCSQFGKFIIHRSNVAQGVDLEAGMGSSIISPTYYPYPSPSDEPDHVDEADFVSVIDKTTVRYESGGN